MGTIKRLAKQLLRQATAFRGPSPSPGGSVVADVPVDGFWSTGIAVSFGARSSDRPSARWSAEAVIMNSAGGFPGRSRGTVGTAKAETLDDAVNIVREEIARLGVVWWNPTVYAEGSSLPADWKQVANDQARRVGWKPYYRVASPDHLGSAKIG